MVKKLRVIHILGIFMFFGSILAHTVASIYASTSEDTQILYIVRQVMQAETKFVLIPGLFLFLFSGIAMIKVNKVNFRKSRWLILHAAIGLLVVLNSFFILLPAGRELLELSHQVAGGSVSNDAIQALKKTETLFGGINLIFCLILIVLGITRPKLGAN